ncbi:uncharacterized protein DUF2071 [Larkinella arboricola]|uniref:Uncharacterized protein DUF2071 n=1 Tax=Larkinella arboricola TaxID=643671 RepID=A0A327WNT5_LARAB|nr:DUF2071 domain-containing protein [Larkinella arboricola]RAJ93184.1 uncharacterized protein DUF2071 [Larkinella arboricola]
MFDFLRNHPFAVEAFFEYSLVLTYALPQQDLQPLIPECLRLDTFQDRWAFVALALVQTKALRPKGLPAFLGSDFFLMGYRIFVRYATPTGRHLRGLYILRSETDSTRMAMLGSVFTHYGFTATDIDQHEQEDRLQIRSQKSGVDILVNTHVSTGLPLPAHSPFPSWQQARRYAGPLPFTFSVDPHHRHVLIVEGLREQWHPKPVEVIRARVPLLQAAPFQHSQLASAFIIRQLPYWWKPGQRQPWNP